MPLPDSSGAYHDCHVAFEHAMRDPAGARVCFGTFAEAKHFQLRMNYCRTIQRRDSMTIYAPNSPQWNTSPFDQFQVKSPIEDTNGEWWVHVERRGLNILAIEPLTETKERQLLEDQRVDK